VAFVHCELGTLAVIDICCRRLFMCSICHKTLQINDVFSAPEQLVVLTPAKLCHAITVKSSSMSSSSIRISSQNTEDEAAAYR
jgi:hypothetical protein